MIELFADNKLIYDSRADENQLIGLRATLSIDKAGSAEIIMPPDHPGYNLFVSYKTIVDIYRDGVRRFRGRALYPEDDFYLRRTIVCEGERCFFRDAVIRPYGYDASPTDVFTSIINKYNREVEKEKQFVVGTITVTHPNVTIQFESDEAELFSDAIDKLIAICGGYLVFTDNSYGERTINWLDSMNFRSEQAIELGVNLLDFQRTTANSDLSTVIVPYGEVNEETGRRIDITSVNGGRDYIQDDAAVALRGRIMKAVTFDNIHDPRELLISAQQYLNNSKNLVTSLTLSAIDLSVIDKNIDSFMVGDNIKVITAPHGIYNSYYLLAEQTLDFLYPQNDRITLGSSAHGAKSPSLTGLDAEGEKKNATTIKKLTDAARKEITKNTEGLVEEVRKEVMTVIQQTTDSLSTTILEEYVTKETLQNAISTTMTQLSDSFEFLFEELSALIDGNDADAREQYLLTRKYIRFVDGNILIGEEGNKLMLRIENDRISFLDDGAEVAYFSDKHLNVVDGTFINSLRLGGFEARIRENGNLALSKVGG